MTATQIIASITAAISSLMDTAAASRQAGQVERGEKATQRAAALLGLLTPTTVDELARQHFDIDALIAQLRDGVAA